MNGTKVAESKLIVNPLTKDPIGLFAHDRSLASSRKDPLANLCYLATVDDSGNPAVRALVLRDVSDTIGIFLNASSPKFREIGNSSAVSVLMYFPSVGVQYRMKTELKRMEGETVQKFWANRPQTSKKLDWLYSSNPQSSIVESRSALLSQLAKLEEPNEAPESATGFYFDPILSIERLALRGPDDVHERRKFVLDNDTWQVYELVP